LQGRNRLFYDFVALKRYALAISLERVTPKSLGIPCAVFPLVAGLFDDKTRGVFVPCGRDCDRANVTESNCHFGILLQGSRMCSPVAERIVHCSEPVCSTMLNWVCAARSHRSLPQGMRRPVRFGAPEGMPQRFASRSRGQPPMQQTVGFSWQRARHENPSVANKHNGWTRWKDPGEE
jgi:hypothetical protein